MDICFGLSFKTIKNKIKLYKLSNKQIHIFKIISVYVNFGENVFKKSAINMFLLIILKFYLIQQVIK